VVLQSVKEGDGLSGVPALNSFGERSANCTSASSPDSGESHRLSSGYRFLEIAV
jgi:hypothetical protein